MTTDQDLGKGRRSRGSKGHMSSGVKKRLVMDILDSGRTGRSKIAIAKDYEVTAETVSRYIRALRIHGYDIRLPHWTRPDEEIARELIMGRKPDYLGGGPIDTPPTNIAAMHKPHDKSLPINGNQPLTLDERRFLLSTLATGANIAPAARVGAVKLLDDIELTHKPAASFAPPTPLTDEERLARLERVMAVCGRTLSKEAFDSLWPSSPQTAPS